jgi:hypothetical protein
MRVEQQGKNHAACRKERRDNDRQGHLYRV